MTVVSPIPSRRSDVGGAHDRRPDCGCRYAARGLLNEPQALYGQSRLALGGLDPARVNVTFVPGTNHYTILGPGVGAQAVTRALLG